MLRIIVCLCCIFTIAISPVIAGLQIQIDAQKDSFYTALSGPEDGHLILAPADYLPFSGPKPDSAADLSAKVWMAWDDEYLYIYTEILDDIINVNCEARPWNDCIELKFDPDPSVKALTGIVNVRLTAYDSADVEAENHAGVDNLYTEGNLDSSASSPENYARRQTENGYFLEMRLKWEWIRTEGRRIDAKTGTLFGFGINIHDNDSEDRDGSLNWSAGMADEIWNTPQLLGTAELLPGNKIRLYRRNHFHPEARAGFAYLSKPRFNKWGEKTIRLENWLYHPGDNPQWSEPHYDDSDWEIIHPVLTEERLPASGWENIGWFRIHFVVDSSLIGVPVGFNFDGVGAAEFYLNGDSLYQFGKADSSAQNEIFNWQFNPRLIVFRGQSDHVLAIRYSNSYSDDLYGLESGAGFVCLLELDPIRYIDNRISIFRTFTIYEAAFTVIPLIIGLFHIFLFVFYRRARENLYFSLVTICWALVVFGHFHSPFFTGIDQMLLLAKIRAITFIPAIVFGLLTLYTIIYENIPRQIWIFIGIAVVVAIWILIDFFSRILGIIIYVTIGLGTLEIFRIMIFAGFNRWRKRWLTLVGFAVFMVALVYQILQSLLGLPEIGEYGILYVYGLLTLSILVSIDLSLNFARTSRDLENRLNQVKELSQKALENERQARKEELARQLLEADNERKTQELEEARQLQLSMLPRDIPMPAHLEIAAKMITANEVGGDYYDFYMAPDKTLTIAIGDATGHGMRAGTMVASIKSLFAAFGNHLKISDFFNRCTEIIKDMKMGNIFMGMMLVRLNGKKLIAAAAGMPPILIYRHGTKKVEDIVLKGMPIGAHRNFKYNEKSVTISGGDVILLMTDGLPELFNQNKEMFDYPRLKNTFLQIANLSASQIIDELVQAGEKWRGEQPLADDCTYVIIKVKENR
jgi:serine phosphatase RsbU (regulator of sigma subunit)